jgi:hypothetical protein
VPRFVEGVDSFGAQPPILEETAPTAHTVGVAQAAGMPLDSVVQAGFRDLQSP